MGVMVGPCQECGNAAILDYNAQCVGCTFKTRNYRFYPSETLKAIKKLKNLLKPKIRTK